MIFGSEVSPPLEHLQSRVCALPPLPGWTPLPPPPPPPPSAQPPAQAGRCSIGHIRRLAHLSPVDSLLFTVCAASTGCPPPPSQQPGGERARPCVRVVRAACVGRRPFRQRCSAVARGGRGGGVGWGGLMLAGGTGEVALQGAPGVRPSSL